MLIRVCISLALIAVSTAAASPSTIVQERQEFPCACTPLAPVFVMDDQYFFSNLIVTSGKAKCEDGWVIPGEPPQNGGCNPIVAMPPSGCGYAIALKVSVIPMNPNGNGGKLNVFTEVVQCQTTDGFPLKGPVHLGGPIETVGTMFLQCSDCGPSDEAVDD